MPIRSTQSSPAHYELSRSQRIFSGVSIAGAFLLVVALAFRIAAQVDGLAWWVPIAFVCGIAAADFSSGLVHWAADTWGRDDMPIVGHRLLVPFRIHHINPEDFLRRRFLDTNGDVAFIAVPMLLALLALPLDAGGTAGAAVFGLGFCGVGMLTNQIHQWAHMPAPPRPIGMLQDCGLILGRAGHAEHHERPHNVHYCITTGWWNQPLEAIGFFRRLESAITAITGLRPREDDGRYVARYG